LLQASVPLVTGAGAASAPTDELEEVPDLDEFEELDEFSGQLPTVLPPSREHADSEATLHWSPISQNTSPGSRLTLDELAIGSPSQDSTTLPAKVAQASGLMFVQDSPTLQATRSAGTEALEAPPSSLAGSGICNSEEQPKSRRARIPARPRDCGFVFMVFSLAAD
jgi:hypothetical protein